VNYFTTRLPAIWLPIAQRAGVLARFLHHVVVGTRGRCVLGDGKARCPKAD